MSRTVVRSSLCLAVAIALLVSAAYAVAGKGGVPLTVILPTLSSVAGLRGDNIDLSGYADGDFQSGAITVLRVQLISNSKTLALDTRGAGRTLLVDFGTPQSEPSTKCLKNGLIKDDLEDLGLIFAPGTSVVDTEALLEVLLSQPFTSLTRPTPGIAKLWFTTIDGSDWRVDWPDVTVAPHPDTSGAWLVTATVPAGLSKLSGKRTKPGTIGTEGCYDIVIYLLANELFY